MYALVELHDNNYQPLADLTWDQNKVLYAEEHGYKVFCKTDNFKENASIGFQKIHYIRELLDLHPEVEWFWWTGTDTLVTNFGTRIEDRIDTRYHFIIAVDVNGINADSFLVRNTEEARLYLDRVISLEQESYQFWDTEQWAMARALGFPGTGDPSWPFGEDLVVNNEFKDIVKIVPQRYMNSFNYQLYHYTDHRDKLGWDGNWQLGDWLIHWPACSLEYRLQLAEFYREHIII